MFGICSVPFIAGAITTVQSVLQFDGGIRRTIITMITYICADYRDSAYIHQSDRTLCVGRFPYYRGRGVFGHWGYFYDAGIQSIDIIYLFYDLYDSIAFSGAQRHHSIDFRVSCSCLEYKRHSETKI